jgi:hypothetical protein
VGESNGAVNAVEPIKHTLQSITAPVAEDMKQMQQNLKSVSEQLLGNTVVGRRTDQDLV